MVFKEAFEVLFNDISEPPLKARKIKKDIVNEKKKEANVLPVGSENKAQLPCKHPKECTTSTSISTATTSGALKPQSTDTSQITPSKATNTCTAKSISQESLATSKPVLLKEEAKTSEEQPTQARGLFEWALSAFKSRYSFLKAATPKSSPCSPRPKSLVLQKNVATPSKNTSKINATVSAPCTPSKPKTPRKNTVVKTGSTPSKPTTKMKTKTNTAILPSKPSPKLRDTASAGTVTSKSTSEVGDTVNTAVFPVKSTSEVGDTVNTAVIPVKPTPEVKDTNKKKPKHVTHTNRKSGSTETAMDISTIDPKVPRYAEILSNSFTFTKISHILATKQILLD
ncbi:hypothetical protein NECAME_16643 [Necator americanus]|uniref:Uncharacterized protein n=1 Tax=Necator americanus TaxID=51031 RepID=W2TVZ3_NECAM|nr:hypothetical protein NECAME_16643 [Necator americanus]ETN85814.1 hypothetical protein NECAME_16643 [Necator americanus]